MELTQSQQEALRQIQSFLGGSDLCFILTGNAGSGKTTVIASLVDRFTQEGKHLALLAPTGRAARILGQKAASRAWTIHSKIYAFRELEIKEDAEEPGDPGIRVRFGLRACNPVEELLVIDEASMLSDIEDRSAVLQFGTGRLLSDLMSFTATTHTADRPGPKILFVGDPAQLPPVGQTLSPALSADYLKSRFGVSSRQLFLSEVLRQREGSGILKRASALRAAIATSAFNSFDLRPVDADVLNGDISLGVDLVSEACQQSYGSAVLIGQSNAKVLDLNRAVRGRLFGDDQADLTVGDILLVNHNSTKYDLNNGDLLRVYDVGPRAESCHVPIRGVHGPVQLRFRPARVAFSDPHSDPVLIDCLLLENLLQSPDRALSPLVQRALLVHFQRRHPKLRPGTAEFSLTLMDDPYFNALQVKYGYAMTCHKAQGGEWDTAVILFSGNRGTRNEEFFRWAYTAITRAKRRLVTVNAPRFDACSTIEWGRRAPHSGSTPDPASGPIAGVTTESDLAAGTDPDWKRFSFGSSDARLFEYFRQLRTAYAVLDVDIVQVEHLQYCERYHLMRRAKRASLQFWYRGDWCVSRVQAAGSAGDDADLVAEAADVMQSTLCPCVRGDSGDIPGVDVSDLRRRVEAALSGTDMRIVETRRLQYCVRMAFETPHGRVGIDFFHDKTGRWTRAQEVGGPGASGRLLEHLADVFSG